MAQSFKNFTPDSWVQIVRKHALKGNKGQILRYDVLPDMVRFGEVPRIRLQDGQEVYVVNPKYLKGIADPNKKRTRRKKSEVLKQAEMFEGLFDTESLSG